MTDPLNRRMIIALLAILPTFLFALASQAFNPPPQPVRPSLMAAEIAELPGGPADAPLITEAALPQSALTLDEMDRARAANLSDPFYTGLVAPAAPFRFTGTYADRTNARDCLALAAMAEAGNTDEGQRAVIQVILNRVRHPAFAKTVCGVVFEGSQRRTGCQFTFTCDGSLTRKYGDLAWAQARDRADQALGGRVDAAVGTATHYHTDWVYPSWSPKLQKIAQVETHLFYRWPGDWGTAKSWQGYRGGEMSFAALLSGPEPQTDASGTPEEADASAAIIAPLPKDTPKITGGSVVMRLPSGKANFVVVNPHAGAASALTMAKTLCTSEGTCRVMGWTSRGQIPATFPLPKSARETLQFSYSRDPGGAEITLYNCDSFKGLPREHCIPAAR
ncbi:MAG: cell wall hydrolase [Novosphingobium sp.]